MKNLRVGNSAQEANIELQEKNKKNLLEARESKVDQKYRVSN